MNHKRDTCPTTPCRQHPGDWSDPKRRSFTRQQCLQCPIRSDCADSALRNQPVLRHVGRRLDQRRLHRKQHLLLPDTPPAPNTDPPSTHARTLPAVTSARTTPRAAGESVSANCSSPPHHRPSPHSSPPAPAVTAKSWPPPAPTSRPPSSPAAAAASPPAPGQPRRRHRRLP